MTYDMYPLACGISSIGKDRLTRDPLTFSAEELHNRSDIFHIGQAALESIALVVGNCFWRFLRIEECYNR